MQRAELQSSLQIRTWNRLFERLVAPTFLCAAHCLAPPGRGTADADKCAEDHRHAQAQRVHSGSAARRILPRAADFLKLDFGRLDTPMQLGSSEGELRPSSLRLLSVMMSS